MATTPPVRSDGDITRSGTIDMGKTRILYIIDELGPGGAERRLIQLLRRLDKEQFSAKLILLTDIVHYSEVYDLNIEVIKLKRRIRFDPLIFFKLFRICREWRPGIIHAWGSMPAIYAGPIARMMKTKLINAMIASAPRKLSVRQRLRAFLSFPFSDIIQSNSYAGLEAYGVSGEKGNVIHNGFDFDRIRKLKDKDTVKKGLNIRTTYTVGMVAGFHPLKDYESLIQAGKTILEERDDVTFVCVGSGTDLERIKSLAEFSDKFIFPGRINDVESIVNTFDIGILSTYYEGISNSIMEYMALSKPVIASEGGGTGELVVDGRTGFIIPQKSPGILTEKITRLLNDSTLRETMGKSGRERIENEFDISRMTGEHMSLYNKLVSNRG